MPNADLSEAAVAPNDDGSEHIIDPPLEVRCPEAGQLSCGAERGIDIQHRVEAGILAGLMPRLAHAHNPPPSLLQGEAGEDVDEALVSQLGPVRLGVSLSLIHFHEICWNIPTYIYSSNFVTFFSISFFLYFNFFYWPNQSHTHIKKKDTSQVDLFQKNAYTRLFHYI